MDKGCFGGWLGVCGDREALGDMFDALVHGNAFVNSCARWQGVCRYRWRSPTHLSKFVYCNRDVSSPHQNLFSYGLGIKYD